MSDYLQDFSLDHAVQESSAAARRDAQKEAAQHLERRICNTIVKLASSPDGLVFMRWFIGQSEILLSKYPADHAQAAYREGRRCLGAQLIALAAQAGVLPQILKETIHDRG